jgi:hypothetical protein
MSETGSQVVIYKDPGGSVSLEVKLQGETVWLSLNQMAELFGRDKSVISRHLRKVFRDNELDRNSVVAFFATTAADRKTYKVEYFNERGDVHFEIAFLKRGEYFCTHVLHEPPSRRGLFRGKNV